MDVIKISEKSLDKKSKNKNESSLVSEDDLVQLKKEKEDKVIKKDEVNKILDSLEVKTKTIKRK